MEQLQCMRAVLMIAYLFPPEGAAGATRPLLFARYLPRFGWHPIVVASHPVSYSRYDPDLAWAIPPDLEIYRARHTDPWLQLQAWRAKRISKNAHPSTKIHSPTSTNEGAGRWSWLRSLVEQIEPILYHPDRYMTWILSAYLEGSQLLRTQASIKAVWATAGPLSDLVVGYLLSRRFNRPLVVDFRDAWTVGWHPWTESRPSWARRLDHKMMELIFEQASAAIFLHQPMAEAFLSQYSASLSEEKVYLIPNGFDDRQISTRQNVSATSETPRRALRLVYTGTLTFRRVDTLYQALRVLREEDQVWASRLQLHLVGEMAAADQDLIKEFELAGQVVAPGIVTRAEARQYQLEADVLLLLMEQFPDGKPGQEWMVSSKVFDYLATGKPILAVMPKNEAWHILRDLGISILAHVEDVAAIVEMLRDLYAAWEKGSLHDYAPGQAGRMRYSASNLTRQLATVLDAVSAVEKD